MKKLIWLVGMLPIGVFQMGCGQIISSEIHGSREYNLGMEAFRSSTRAHELLGDHPDAAEGNPGANSYTSGGNGSAELTVPVSGSIHKGTLYIKAAEKSGQWHIDELALRLEGQSNWTDLLHSTSR
jgi:Cytochrome oxidase complex assembly protein 1